MKCSECSVYFPANWEPHVMLRGDRGTRWAYRTAECPACAELTIEVGRTDNSGELIGAWVRVNGSPFRHSAIEPEPPHLSWGF
jgi:hypothetical protein